MARYVAWFIAALSFLAVAGVAQKPPAPATPGKDFVPLYNGVDLSGWEVADGKLDAWQADGELLSCVAAGGGWLRTSTLYSDFVLKLEYRLPRGGNSGVGLRIPASGNPAHAGMEIQILDDDDEQYKDLVPAQYTGGIYYQVAAKRGAAKPPGEWNTYEITCRGPQVKVILNGEVINDLSVDRVTKGEGGHPALADRPEIGSIALQSHESRVDFRHLSIKDLTATTKSGVSYVDLVVGSGPVVPTGATVVVHYTGRLTNGRRFASSRETTESKPTIESLDDVIVGWREGIPGMKVGGRRKLIIPPQLAYGEKRRDKIPPNSMLIFDVEVLEIR